jgi:Glycosyl transferases group 1
MIPGLLLIYRHPLAPGAATIMEHVNAFSRYSRFPIWTVNTEFGFPAELGRLQFRVILLHYSLFGAQRYMLDERFLNYLETSQSSYKAAMFQDEHHRCGQRFEFIKHYNLDSVYTLIEPEQFGAVYRKYTHVPQLVYNLPGYVSEDLIAAAGKYSKPDPERRIDVGYRGRRLLYYMGRGSQEKAEIGIEFKKRAQGLGLKLDIEVDERRRQYGKDWHTFLGDCRAFLGVEAGVSIFDTEDKVLPAYERLIGKNPKITFEELSRLCLAPWEDNIYYRTISPRHFEAAAFRTCQILYEGKYSGILQPMVHYIPLKKDWSNFEEAIRRLRDDDLRHELTENAYRDLIASGRYSYKHFIREFDDRLEQAGVELSVPAEEVTYIKDLLESDLPRRRLWSSINNIRTTPFPGRSKIYRLVKSVSKPGRVES